MDFDIILKDVDEFGAYQRLMLAFVLLPGFVPCGFHAYNQLFMAATPPHHCRIPVERDLNSSYEQLINISLPYEIGEDGKEIISRCQMYDLPWQNVSPSQHSSIELVDLVQNLDEFSTDESEKRKVSCKYGWQYDHSTYVNTAVTEWDLVCDKDFYTTLALFLLGLGGLVGNLIFGILQDTYGRRPSFFIYLTIQCVFGILTGLAQDFWTWLVFRIGVGFTVPAITGTPFVLALELVAADERTLCTILLNIAYSLCLMALPLVAYFQREWRKLAFATTVPFFTFFFYWWVLPESPRWLFAHGRLDETEKILRQIAQVNGKKLPPNYKNILKEKYLEMKEDSELLDSDGKSTYSIVDLMRGKVLRRNTFIITFIWFLTLGAYVGLSYYAPELGGDDYFNFFLAGFAELPTYLFLFPCLNYAGRRWTLCGSMIIGGAACVSTILVKNEHWITLLLFCIGKFGISAAFVAIQQMAAEIYPTVVRGLGISFSNVVGMIGPAIAPLINYTGRENLYLPLLILGFLMITGGVIALWLPETLGRPLPQTLKDAENFLVDCTSFKGCCCPQTTKKGIPVPVRQEEEQEEE